MKASPLDQGKDYMSCRVFGLVAGGACEGGRSKGMSKGDGQEMIRAAPTEVRGRISAERLRMQ